MAMLGSRNWYLPPWLSWLPDIHVEGAPQPVRTGDESLVPGTAD
jgi:RND superfamily putative drug exporter